MNSDLDFDDKNLNQERTDIRENKKIFTEEDLSNIFLQHFQVLNDIPNINVEKMNALRIYIQSNFRYINLISTIFPYPLCFRILLENPIEEVKKRALKLLSFFAQFLSFPFNEMINSPYSLFMLDTLKNTTYENVVTSIVNIFTYLLKTHSELRDYFISVDILNILSQKLISSKIPAFLEVLLKIHPLLQPEIISQINILYGCLLDKCTNIQNRKEKSMNTYIIQSTIKSITHLLKEGFSPFDYSFVMNYIDILLDCKKSIIIHQTIRMIGFLPFPTIQYAQKCISLMSQDIIIIHTMLKVFIRKSDEWIGDQDIIVGFCIGHALTPNTSFDEKLLCLKVLFKYFPFHRDFDEEMCEILIQFVTFPEVSLQCIEKLTIMENADFEDNEKQIFVSMILDSISEFQSVIDESDDENTALLVNNFLNQIEQMKE